jgi:hypothetical protein
VQNVTPTAERDQALSQIGSLRHLLRRSRRAQFGRRAEKLDPELLLLALEDFVQASGQRSQGPLRTKHRRGDY